MPTPDEQLIQSLLLRAPPEGGTRNFDPIMREALRIQNEAVRQQAQQPDTSEIAKAGFAREMQGMNDQAAGLAMATGPRQFAPMAGQTYRAGLEAVQPWQVGEGTYMPGTGYVQDPFKKQDRLSKAMQAQASFGTHMAGAYGTQEHQQAQEAIAREHARQQQLQLEATLKHQRAMADISGGHLALARQQAEMGKIMQVDDPATGLKQTVRVSMTPQGPQLVPLGTQGAAAPAPGAAPPMPNLKGEEAKALGYAMRAREASKILETIGGGYSPASVAFKGGLERTRGIGGALGSGYNMVMGAPEQQVEQAQRDFINAILRPESGAVINPEEFQNARLQYFPQPGDPPELIAQKKRNRELKIQGLLIEAGPLGVRYYGALEAAKAPGSAQGGLTPPGAAPAAPGFQRRAGDQSAPLAQRKQSYLAD